MRGTPVKEATDAANIATMTRQTDYAGSAFLPRLSVKANFRWTLAGNLVHAVSLWGMLTVLARLGSPEVLGQFVLGLSIAAPVMALTMLQLRHVQVTDARREYGFEHYFGTRVTWTFVGLVAIAACVWLGGFDSQTAWVVLLVGLAKCVDSVTDIVRGLFQQHERMDYSAISLMLKGPSALGALALLMWWTGDIVPAVAAMAIVWIGSFVLYDAVKARYLLAGSTRTNGTARRFRPRFTWKVMLALTWIAFPLGVVMALISLQINMPRYVLEGHFGKEALGYFGAMVYPMAVGTMVTGALGQAASPRLARYYLDDLGAFRTMLGRLLLLSTALGTVLVVGTVMLGRPILALLYGADYAQYQREFVVLAIAAAIQMVASCWGYGLTAARFFRVQVVLTITTCLAAVVSAFLLIPRWGVMGAAATALVTSTVMCIVFALAMWWAIRRRLRQGVGQNGPGPHSPVSEHCDSNQGTEASSDTVEAR